MFRRVGLAADQPAIERIAHVSVDFGIRTLQAAATVVEWAQAEGLAALEDAVHGDAIMAALEPAANAECVQRTQQLMESIEAQASEAAATASPKLILP